MRLRSPGNRVKDLKCTFTNEAGLSAKPKKISPKMTSRDSTRKELTFRDYSNGTISGNLIT